MEFISIEIIFIKRFLVTVYLTIEFQFINLLSS